MAELHLPLEAYLLDYEHAGKLEVLRFRLRDRCMKARGFAPSPMSVTGDRAAAQYVKLWQFYDTRRYAISDLATAREYGYHLPPFTVGSAEPVALGSLSQPMQDALKTCDEQVAEEESQAGMSSGLKQSYIGSLATDLKAKDFLTSQSDPRVLDAIRKWSLCMAQRGYRYATPQDAAKDTPRRVSGRQTPETLKAEITPAETDTAVAEVECVYATNLLGVSFAVEAQDEKKDIEKDAEALDKLKKQTEQDAKTIDELWAQSG